MSYLTYLICCPRRREGGKEERTKEKGKERGNKGRREGGKKNNKTNRTEIGLTRTIIFIIDQLFGIFKIFIDQCVSNQQVTSSSNVLFCPETRETQLIVRKEQRNQKCSHLRS